MIGILLTVLVAALVYLILAALTAPIVGIIGAILVLIAGIPSGGFGFGSRWGGGRNRLAGTSQADDRRAPHCGAPCGDPGGSTPLTPVLNGQRDGPGSS